MKPIHIEEMAGSLKALVAMIQIILLHSLFLVPLVSQTYQDYARVNDYSFCNFAFDWQGMRIDIDTTSMALSGNYTFRAA